MITFKAASFSTQTNKHQNLQKEQVVSVNIKCTVNECWVWWIVLVASRRTQSIDSLSYLPTLWWLLSKFVSNIHSTLNRYRFLHTHWQSWFIQIKDVMFRVIFLSLDYWYFWSSSKIYLWIIEYIWNIFIIKTKHRWSVCLRVCVLDMLCPNTSPMFCFIELQK